MYRGEQAKPLFAAVAVDRQKPSIRTPHSRWPNSATSSVGSSCARSSRACSRHPRTLHGYNVDRESGEFAVEDPKKAIRLIADTPGVEAVHLRDLLMLGYGPMLRQYLRGNTGTVAR